MYQFDRAERSLWESDPASIGVDAEPLVGDTETEVAIIGGGYTGLSAAYHLGRDFDVECRVLEAGHLGWGASGRNGGFCSIGGTAVELDTLMKRYGLEETRAYYQAQVEAVRLVRELITEERIDARLQGDAELEVAHTPRAFELLKAHAEQSRRYLALDRSTVTAERFKEQFFDSTEQHGALVTKPTFGLHPLRYLRGLAGAAKRHGSHLHPRSEVLEWSRTRDRHVLATATGTVRARSVILATNAYMPEYLRYEFDARALPVLSAIVVTRPLSAAELAAHGWQTECPAINCRHLLNYFRLLPDKRFLFGGRGHTTGSAEGTARNFRRLIDLLWQFWPEWRVVDIDYRWHGLVCFTRRLTPSIGRLDDDASVYFAFGYHGNGVNTATWAGKQLAAWVGLGGVRQAPALPAPVRGLPARFPLAALRLSYLQARIAWLGLKDRCGR